MIDKFKSKTYTKETINEAANDLENVIIQAADMSLTQKEKEAMELKRR